MSSDDPSTDAGQPSAATPSNPGNSRQPHHTVCLGASAGGLEALEQFFAALPSDTGASFVIVMHLSPDFKSLMPELLARHTSMKVCTVHNQIMVEPNTIYIIPPSKNMAFRDGQLLLEAQDRSGLHVLQLPIDIFIRSLANSAPHRSIAIILSGTGSDGSRGIRELKDAGGTILVQTPESSKFDGMPRAAIETGVVDATGTPAALASTTAQILRRGVVDVPDAPDDSSSGQLGNHLEAIIDAMRVHLAVDLSYLRRSMLNRRVSRRMTLLGVPTIEEYIDKLQNEAAEARALCVDTMIGVTSFFRDPESFVRLQKQVVTDLLRQKPEEQFRVWVPACSTGEEAYSIAMIIHEALEANSLKRDVKIFATDLDEESLARASRASYPISAIADIGQVRAGRYFNRTTSSLTVKQEIREQIIFAHHNLVKDPPFTRINVVSCRNFLIYLTPECQESVLASLHFALRRNGILFLGSAEVLGQIEPEFDVIDARHKVFRKARNAILPALRTRGLRDVSPVVVRAVTTPRDRDRESAHRQVIETLLTRDQVTAALVSPDGVLLDILSDPLEIFRVPKGRPTNDVLRLLVDQLTVAVTTGLQRLRRGETMVEYGVRLSDEDPRHMTARVSKLPAVGTSSERVLLTVEQTKKLEPDHPLDMSTLDKDSSLRMKELQTELMQTRESLQATIEELQSANEEQQSTNEELVASNEELQSTNEELQSVNEELFTVNTEYQNKNQELAVVAADLTNLIANVNVGLLFLDADLRIRKFTAAMEEVVRLVDYDIGRSVDQFSDALGRGFVDDCREVAASGNVVEREFRPPSGTWMLMRIMPYVTRPGDATGIVASFIDVTAIKNAQEMARVGAKQLAQALRDVSNQREELEQMFSIVAHDLKRPVVALNGLLSIIEGDSGAGETEKMLPKAMEECRRMRQMLADLESISGIQTREIVTSTVSLQPWVDELVERFAAEGDKRGVRINCTCDKGEHMIAAGIVAEVFNNIMENALKYGCTDPKPRIDVSCRAMDGVLELSVADNGAGIAPENHKKVFEPFRRLNPKAAEGSGIGLMAVRRLLMLLGGSVTLSSSLGEGAKFTVRVPIHGAARTEGNEPVAKTRVLLVEDDALDAKLIERALGREYVTTRVTDLQEAESKLKQEFFHLVLLDLSLPDGHGLALVDRIQTALGMPIPIVVISGHGEGIPESSMSQLVGGFVSKDGLTTEALRLAIVRAVAAHAHRGAPEGSSQ